MSETVAVLSCPIWGKLQVALVCDLLAPAIVHAWYLRVDRGLFCCFVCEACIIGGEIAAAFLVGEVEIVNEIVPCVLCRGAFAPIFEGIGEHARVSEIGDGSSNGCGFSDGIMGLRIDSAFADLVPKVFEWLTWVPLAGHVLEVCVKVIKCYCAIRGVQMSQ